MDQRTCQATCHTLHHLVPGTTFFEGSVDFSIDESPQIFAPRQHPDTNQQDCGTSPGSLPKYHAENNQSDLLDLQETTLQVQVPRVQRRILFVVLFQSPQGDASG